MPFQPFSHAVSARAAAGLVLIGLAAGCGDGPTSPSRFIAPRPSAAVGSPAPAAPLETVEIAGHLWLHDGGGRQSGTGRVSGFAFAPRSGRGLLPADVAADGRYRLRAPADALVYLTSSAGHQPCMTAVSTAGVSEVTGVDLHVVTDRTRLGAHLPPDLPQHPNRVTGVVFEALPDGRRVPIAGAWVVLDGAAGDGLVIAGTLTDADGRFILCGVTPAIWPGIGVTLVTSLERYGPRYVALAGTADVVIDIPFSR